MSITKDSKEWTQALALVPPTKEDLGPDCHIAHPGTRCPDRRPPDITPDLLCAIRRAIEARGYQWAMRYWDTGEGHEYEFAIDDGMKLVGFARGTTEEEVSIRAAASLQEAKCDAVR